jgi:transcriptional regulator with XRE-family HTH domain
MQYYAVLFILMQEDLSLILKKIMGMHGLSQMSLAQRAGVSQSTVSRALKGLPLRYGRARSKLISYAVSDLKSEKITDGAEQIVDAFQRIWDGSEAHAAAVVKVIEALEGLHPWENRKRKK